MSRSMGDVDAHRIGVTSEPDIQEVELKDQDKIVVIASDGIWDVLENSRVIDIVEKFYEPNDAEKASEALVNEARKIWKKEYVQIDDATAMTIYLGNSA